MTRSLTSSLTGSADLLAREERVLARSGKIQLYPFAADRARGTRVWDVDGQEYLDWEGLAGVAATGYGHQEVRAAIIRTLDAEFSQLLVIAAHESAVELAERLVKLIPGDFAKKVWFGSSGSDALDYVVKVLPVSTGKPRLVSFIGGHHGMTVGSGSISGDTVQTHFPTVYNIVRAPYPYPYRCSWGPCDPDECSLKCLRFLEDAVLRAQSPPEQTAAIVIEPIQSFSGEIVPPRNYLPALRELCDRYGIMLVVDEVKTGLGRTGRMFAFEHADIVPDVVTLGKGLGGGMPLSGVVGRADILDGAPTTAQALGGSPVPCAAAVATLAVIESEGLVDNARDIGAVILAGLGDLAVRSRLIGDVRGQGLMIGVELVRDRQTREPAPLDAARLAYRCFELGLLLITVGSHSNVIEITPPLTTSGEDAQRALAVFEHALADVESGRFDDTKLGQTAGKA